MKIRDDRIANYSFHSISLGRREYPEQSQPLSPFLSITHWERSCLPLPAVLCPAPRGDEGATFPGSSWKSLGESQCRLTPSNKAEHRQLGFALLELDCSQPRARQGTSGRGLLSLIFQGSGPWGRCERAGRALAALLSGPEEQGAQRGQRMEERAQCCPQMWEQQQRCQHRVEGVNAAPRSIPKSTRVKNIVQNVPLNSHGPQWCC